MCSVCVWDGEEGEGGDSSSAFKAISVGFTILGEIFAY